MKVSSKSSSLWCSCLYFHQLSGLAVYPQSTGPVQLQFNKPYGCQITLTSKYYKCPELDSCFRDSSKYQPRIIGQSDILSGLESYISHLLLTLHCKPGRVMTCMGGGGTNDHIVTPSLTHGAGDSGNNYICEIIRHQLSLSSLDENQWAGARLRPQLRFVW